MAKDTPKAEVAPAIVRPEDLAEMLEVSGKQIRGFLRQTFPRKAEEKNTSWTLTDEQSKAVIEHFEARKAKAQASNAEDSTEA